MGLPINGNYYEEWKELLGYTEDDTLFGDNTGSQEASFGGHIICKKDKFINLIHNTHNEKLYLSNNYFSIQFDMVHSVLIQDCPKEQLNVLNDFYIGPIRIGMTVEEMKTAVAFDETNCQDFGEEKQMTYSDNGFVRFSADGSMVLGLSSGDTILTYMENNVVKEINIIFALE